MNLYDVFVGQLKFYRGSAESTEQAIRDARDYMFRTDAQRLGEWDGCRAEFHARMLGPRFPLKAGDRVLCQYRMPTVLQYWIHPVHVGVIQEPGDDVAAWNGYNSERQYCTTCGKLPVQYDGFRQHDTVCDLVPLPAWGKPEGWPISGHDEAVRLAVHVNLATRRPEYVTEYVAAAIRSAFDWHGGGGSAVYEFASWRQVRNEAHRVRLRKELAATIKDTHDPADLVQLLLLDTIAETAEAGEALAKMSDVFPPVLPGVPA